MICGIVFVPGSNFEIYVPKFVFSSKLILCQDQPFIGSPYLLNGLNFRLLILLFFFYSLNKRIDYWL